ncbi:MAG: SpoIID/LytB domain-containing protein [Bacteroidales bacterium]|nr:SpoIID/LytB domain-containing protein [Bacteroidales bacterium]
MRDRTVNRMWWGMLLVAAVLTVLCDRASAERVKVRIFSNVAVSQINISFDLGSYTLLGDDGVVIDTMLATGRSVAVQASGNKMLLSVDGHNLDAYSTLQFIASDSAAILCLNPRNASQRTYEGNLSFRSRSGRLEMVSDVDFETYLAGVVQSEIYGGESDIYRVQAIISRTWAMRNMKKHAADGYNFCDHVHCQAYHNRCIRPEIMLGTVASSGETIVDHDGNLIETPFHANSGGQTANSEDVWRAAVPYLRSVVDTFSNGMKQSEWTKTMKADKWLGYFSKTHHIDINDKALRDSLLSFQQERRRATLLGVKLAKVRSDLGLRSAYFSVEYNEARGEVTLHGRGYGHGVGLSQEGTIRMVRLGIAYDSIIRHYYHGAMIHNANTIQDIVKMEAMTQQISTIIEEDKVAATQTKSKKEDWLGRLFRLRDREDREEVYDEKKQDLESDWRYAW